MLEVSHISSTVNCSKGDEAFDKVWCLKVCVRDSQDKSMRGTIEFLRGKFLKCSYELPGQYNYNHWVFLGDLSRLIQNMQMRFDKVPKAAKHKEGIVEDIEKICKSAFEA
jgi:hypothetical protein